MVNFKHVHCVGIGGIGLSAVAKFLKLHSIAVTGSEKHIFEVVEDVEKLKIPVTIGFSPANIPHETDLVVYSDAFRDNNVEVNAAHARGIKTISYAEMLGLLTQNTQLFAVTGTNGKSTTTAMLGKILEAAAFDPTVLVGTKVSGFSEGNLRPGNPDIWVVEADDYREHFLALSPTHAIVTNIELDHLDYYPDLGAVEKAFIRFIERVSPAGTLILNADNTPTLALKKVFPTAKTFSITGLADYAAQDIHVVYGNSAPRTVFTILENNSAVGEVALQIPGEMNVANAMAAYAMAREQGIAFTIIKQALEAFTGVWRRFQVIGANPIIISDYAHHPTAVAPTIAAAKSFYKDMRIVAVFQPHQEDRLHALFDEFTASFDDADAVILAPVFKATGRESGMGATSEKLAEAITLRDAEYKRNRMVLAFQTNEEVIAWLTEHGEKTDCILLMTAGDLYNHAAALHTALETKFA